eukprot:m.135099 g.135099  ORF g.135099 m.135099 type:complete len:805 (+) comp13117_c0_seq12:112-2526(+)
MSFCGCEGWLLCAIDKGKENLEESVFHPRFLLLTDQEIYFFDKAVTTKEARAFGGVTTFETVDDGVSGNTVPASFADVYSSRETKKVKRKLFGSKLKLSFPNSSSPAPSSDKKEYDHIPSVVPLGQALISTNHPSALGDSVSSFPEVFSIYYLDYRIMFWCRKASTRAKWVRALSYVTNTNGITFQRTAVQLGFGKLHGVLDRTEYRILIRINGFIEGKTISSSHMATAAKVDDRFVSFDQTLHLTISQWCETTEATICQTTLLVQMMNKRGKFVTIGTSDTQNADWSGSRRVPRIRLAPVAGVKHFPSILDFDYQEEILTILPQRDYHGVVRWFENAPIARVLKLENMCKNSQFKNRMSSMNEAFFLHLVGSLEHKASHVFSWVKDIIISNLQSNNTAKEDSVLKESSSYGRLNGVMDGLLTGVIALYGTPWLQTALSGLMDVIHEVALRYGNVSVYGPTKNAIEHGDAMIDLLETTWGMIKSAQHSFPAEARNFLFHLKEEVKKCGLPKTTMNLFNNQIKTALILRFLARAICDPFDFGLCSYKFQHQTAVAEWCKELSKSMKVMFFNKVIRQDRFSDELLKLTKRHQTEAETFIAFCQSPSNKVDEHWAVNNHFDSRFSCAFLAYELTLFKRVIENEIATTGSMYSTPTRTPNMMCTYISFSHLLNTLQISTSSHFTSRQNCCFPLSTSSILVRGGHLHCLFTKNSRTPLTRAHHPQTLIPPYQTQRQMFTASWRNLHKKGMAMTMTTIMTMMVMTKATWWVMRMNWKNLKEEIKWHAESSTPLRSARQLFSLVISSLSSH